MKYRLWALIVSIKYFTRTPLPPYNASSSRLPNPPHPNLSPQSRPPRLRKQLYDRIQRAARSRSARARAQTARAGRRRVRDCDARFEELGEDGGSKGELGEAEREAEGT